MLTQENEMLHACFPITIMASYFICGDIEFIKENDRYVGYRVRPSRRLVNAHHVESYHSELDADAWLPMEDGCELFSRCYRTKICSRCGDEKPATEFCWKIAGAEGPFPQIWGKRDSFCRLCRSDERALRYSVKRRQKETLRRRGASTTIWDADQIRVDTISVPFKNDDASVLRDLAERLTTG